MKRESWVLSLIFEFRDAVAHLSMLKAAARPLGGCKPRASPGGEALLKCFIAETICLAGIGNSCFWTHVPCLFNMEKSSSLWDIPCGSLPGTKNRELMSVGDSNLEAQRKKKSPGPEFG